MKIFFHFFVYFYISFCLLNLESANSQDTINRKEFIKIGGEAQIRGELDGRDFSNLTYPLTSTNMRLRLNAEKTIFENLTFFIQLQDSRQWGVEKNSIKNIFNIDLHQGYVSVKDLFSTPLAFQVGRFEVLYSNGRLFGNNNWSFIGRSFDGLRLSYNEEYYKISAFALTHTWFMDNIPNAQPQSYPYPSNPDTSHNIYGIWANLNPMKNHTFDVFGYYDLNRKESDNINPDIARWTIGFNYDGKYDNISTVFNIAYQFGSLYATQFATVGHKEISAWMLLLKLQYSIGALSIVGNVDISSGSSPQEPQKMGFFSAPYSAKHQFWGYMDYFTNMEKGTDYLGLNDYFLTLIYQQKESPFNARFDAHYFTSNKKSVDGLSFLGPELDITLLYKLYKELSIEFGSCVFFPGDLMKQIWKVNGHNRDDPSFFSYLMLRLKI